MDSPSVSRLDARPGRRLFAVALGATIAFLIGGFPGLGAYFFVASLGGLLVFALRGKA